MTDHERVDMLWDTVYGKIGEPERSLVVQLGWLRRQMKLLIGIVSVGVAALVTQVVIQMVH